MLQIIVFYRAVLLISFQLSSFGIKPEQVTFPRATMSSHRWLCCRHTSKKKKRDNCVTVINLTSRTPRPKTWPCTADSAIMNPRKPWLALKRKHWLRSSHVLVSSLLLCTFPIYLNPKYWINWNILILCPLNLR